MKAKQVKALLKEWRKDRERDTIREMQMDEIRLNDKETTDSKGVRNG